MSRYRATMKELLEKVYKEDGHQDVSSSKRMCRTIREDAQQIESKLNSMSPEDSLDTWWTNKLAVSANNLNKARDYIVNDVKEELEEAKIVSDISGISIPKLKKEAQPFNVKVDRVTPGGFDAEYEVTFSGSEPNLIKYAKKHLGFDGNNFSQLKRHLAMEEVELDEGKMKTIATMFDQGQSAKEIAKALKLPISTVKSILGEGINPYVSMQRDSKTGKMNYVVLDKDEKEAFSSQNYILAKDYLKKNYNKLKEETIVEFSDSMLDKLEREYAPLKGKTISVDQANKLRKIFDRIPDRALSALRKRKIPFLSGLALSRMIKKGMPVKEELELDEASAQQIARKAHELGVSATVTSKGIDISGFKTQAGFDKFMKYIASQGKNMINLAKVGMKRNFEEIEEKIQPFMISYSKNGQHAGFEGGNSLSDIQNKAQKLRAKGFTIDKMGRYNPPVKDKTAVYTKDNIKNMIKEEDVPKEEPKKDNEKKESENKDKQIAALKDQISMLKTKIENEKNKAVKPEPNPDTGEVPLTVGVAYKHFKDKAKKEVKEESLEEMSPAEKKKRLQRAKDMIKYYDMMKKRALKGPNKALAKKMLKSELEEATKNTDFKVKMKTPSGMKMVRVTVPIKDFVVDMAKIEDAARKKVKGDMVNFDFVGDIKMEESVGQVQTRPDGKGNFNLIFRGKEIGYYHKERGKYVVYHSKEDGEYSESDVVSTPTQAKKMAYDNMTEADLTKSQIKQVHKVADDLPKKDFKDRYGKEKGDAVRFGTATNMVKKKLGIREDRRLYVETIAGLKKKAEKSGMPYSILKKVYDRGMAAWKSGHRPGASQQQWAFARVNSFVTKSSGTWGGADKDLAKQVRGSK